jgi:hypothetical protein
MKTIILLSLVLISSIAYSQVGSEGVGGGNIIEGKMVESYIFNPRDAEAFKGILQDKMDSILSKHEALKAIVDYGLNYGTWYMLPADLKTLGEQVTGIPFSSTQLAIQNFSTHEIWIDSKTYSVLDSEVERAKLLLHEALLPKIGEFYFPYRMSEIKNVVRQTVSLVFSEEAKAMSKEKFASTLKQIGWGIYDNNDKYISLPGYPQYDIIN